jgi:hypothetical protein
MTQQQLSYGERKMKGHVADVPNAPLAEETPEERAARTARNWDEIKKARINALKARDPKAVAILDAEVAGGRGTDFPHDASFEDDADADLGPLKQIPAARKPAPRGAQADVRKSEPSMHLIEQEAAERGFEQASQDFVAKTGGVLKDGKTHRQAVSEFSGLRDPKETQLTAEAKHAADTGELTYGNSVEFNAVKPLAAIAGFAAKGPAGATAAEALVNATAIGYNINKALDNGLDPDRAVQIFIKEMTKSVALDALFNFGTPLIGQLVAKIPGLNRIADKLHAALQKRIPGPAPRPSMRDESVEALKAKAGTPARAKAVEELSTRVEGDFVPTPGQVTGKPGFAERRVFEAFPGEFQAQEETLGVATEQMRKQLVDAGSQPTQQKLGEQIARITDETVKATKARLRPVFQEADRLRVQVDFDPVADVARNALAKDAAVKGGGKLTATERQHLQKLSDDVATNPWSSAENALDFQSVQKAVMRKINPDGKPSPYFSTVVDDMIRVANDRFDYAARSVPGGGPIVDALKKARDDYRVMMGAAYDGASKQVLRKGEHAPEEIGSYLWANGKVSRIDELDELLGLARREGVASGAAIDKMRRNVTRGFLQEAVKDVKSAAEWSQALADPKRRATWEALTRGPEGKALKETMEVLEQAAQMATLPKAQRQSTFMQVPLARAAGGGLGISWVTMGANPWLAGAGLSIAGAMRLMATAYTHSDKGTLNLLAKVLRSNSTATAASAKALQALLPELLKAAEKYEVKDLFLPAEQAEEQSDEQLGPR